MLRMKTNFWYVIRFMCMVVMAVSVMTGCENPIPGPDDSGVETVIPATTKVLSDEAIFSLVYMSDDNMTIRLLKNAEGVVSLQRGDIIVCGVTAKTPYGLMRKVESITGNESELIIKTSQAKIEEAITSCNLKVERPLRGDEVYASRTLSPRSTIIARPDSRFDFGLGFTREYEHRFDPGGSLYGRVSLSTTLHLDIEIIAGIVTYFKAYVRVDESASAGLDVPADKTIEEEIELWETSWGPYTVMVGIVPVVITPQLVLKAGVDIELDDRIETSVSQNATFKVGVVCNGITSIPDNWSPIASYSNKFSYMLPTIPRGADVKAWIGPRFSLSFYESCFGGISPWIEPHLYLRFKARLTRIPMWELFGGFEADAGVDAFGDKLVRYNDIIDVYATIASAAPPPYTITYDKYNMTSYTSGQGGNFMSTVKIPIYDMNVSATITTVPSYTVSIPCRGSYIYVFDYWQVKAGAVTGNLNQPTTTVTLSSPASVWLSPIYKYRV
jgi:hypothetical protein